MADSGLFSAHAIGVATYCPQLGSIVRKRKETIPLSDSAREEKRGIIQFHSLWTAAVRGLGIVNNGKLGFILRESETKVLQKMMDPLARDRGLAAIRKMEEQIVSLAQSLSVNGKVVPKDLMVGYFGGDPEFNTVVNGAGIIADCDILAHGNETSRIWTFVAQDGLDILGDSRLKNAFVFETLAAAMACGNLTGSSCDAMIVFDGAPKNLRLLPKAKQKILDTMRTLSNDKPLQVSKEACNSCTFRENLCKAVPNEMQLPEFVDAQTQHDQTTETGEAPNIGRVVQNFKRQLEIQAEKKRLYGYLYEDKAEQVHPNEILTAVSESTPSIRLLCRVVGTKSSRLCASIPTKSVEGFVCNVALEPVGINNGTSLDEVPNANFDGNFLQRPSPEDIGILYNLPPHGIPLGFIAAPAADSSIPYLYDPQQIFKSFFVCGGQGTGKTNFLRYMVKTYSASKGKRPAIVLLDVEGQFSDLSRTLSPTAVMETPERSDPVDPLVNLLRISSMEGIGEVTLSFKEVGHRYMQYFVPELPARTTEMLERISQDVITDLVSKNEKLLVQRVLREIGNRATRDGRLHFSQRDAILRATISPSFNVFDQPGKKPLTTTDLLVPGRITVIDASEMSEDDQRIVAIYLMAMLFEAKMKNHQDQPRSSDVILVVDEAHRLFPQRRGLKRDYVTRVAKLVEEITHRGRKRNYGIVLATQSPADISQGIVGLCETKLFFRVAGHQTWLKEHVGNKETVKSIGNLPNFEAYVIVKGSSREPVAIGFPNVSDH